MWDLAVLRHALVMRMVERRLLVDATTAESRDASCLKLQMLIHDMNGSHGLYTVDGCHFSRQQGALWHVLVSSIVVTTHLRARWILFFNCLILQTLLGEIRKTFRRPVCFDAPKSVNSNESPNLRYTAPAQTVVRFWCVYGVVSWAYCIVPLPLLISRINHIC